jgi:hypothetical protein
MSVRRRAATGALVMTMLGMAACGGAETPAQTGMSPPTADGTVSPTSAKDAAGKACRLVTAAEVAPLLEVNDPPPVKDSETECLYAKGLAQVSIMLEPGAFDQAVVDRLLGGNGEKGEKIDGIGEVAYTWKETGEYGTAIGMTVVWTKNQYLRISMFATGGRNPVEETIKLARKAVSRL